MNPKPKECDGCPYADRGRGFVGGVGPSNAKIVLVGETPAERELESGRPFQGPAGHELNELLTQAGIRREEIFITNAIKCMPPYGTKAKELASWAHHCTIRHGKDERWRLDPNLWVAAGGVAAHALGNRSAITKIRGSVFPRESENGSRSKLLPVLHPAATMRWDRSRKMRSVSMLDFRKVAREGRTRELPDTGEKLVPMPSFAEAMMHLGGTLAAANCPVTTLIEDDCYEGKPAVTRIEHRMPEVWVSTDIESTGLSVYHSDILCLCVTTTEASMCIPIFRHDGSPYWADHEFARIIELVAEIFAHPNIPKVTQNGVFDLSAYMLRGFRFAGLIIDTCYLHHTLFVELPHTLAFIASIYTNVPFWKEDIKGLGGGESSEEEDRRADDITFWTYNARDGHVTLTAARLMVQEAKNRGLWGFYLEEVAPLIPAIADMQATGILVDTGRRAALSERYHRELSELAAEMFQIVGREFNPRSKDELARIICGEMGYPPQKQTKKLGRPTVDAEDIGFWLRTTVSDRDRRFFTALSRYSTLEKERSTYIDNVRPDPDGHARCSWAPHGTRTGRLAGKNPPLQTVPESMRELYIAGPGCIMHAHDMSAFEQWIMGYVADDQRLLGVLREGKNIHLATATEFLGRPYEELKTRKDDLADTEFAELYVVMKNYRYGSNYGAAAKTIYEAMCHKMDFPPSLADIQRLQAADYAAFPDVKRFRDAVAA